MTCDAFQVQLEQRRYGGLDPDAASALDAHLATCEACRSYAQGAASVHGALGALAAGAPALSWSELQERMQVAVRTRRSKALRAFAALPGVCLAYAVAVGSSPAAVPSVAGMAAGLVVGAGLYLWGLRAQDRRLARLADRERDLLVELRRQLDLQIRHARASAWLLPLFALFPFWVQPHAGPLALAARALLITAGLGSSLVAFRWTIPGLRRERAELGGTP